MPLYNPALVADGRAKISGVAQYSIPGVDVTALATRTLTASRIYYSPWFVSTPITLDQLAIEVTTAGAAGKLARLAIYNADVDWQPTTKVVDAGTVVVDPGAVPAVTTASISITLIPGRYLSALISDGTPALRVFRGSGRPFGLLAALGTNAIMTQAFVAGSGSALPDPGTAWTGSVGGSTPMEHLIVARVSVP
jgi:hypothetical protein